MMQRKGDRFGARKSFAPINVGDELDVVIEAVGEKGDGMAKVKGFVIFIPNTKEGDSVRIKVTRVLKNVGFAEVLGPAQGGEEKAKEEEEEKAEDEEAEGDYSEETEEDTEDSENF